MKKNHPLLIGLKNVKPYSVVSGDALYDIRPPAMQIEDFLSVGSIMGITSYPGVGKTWVALEVARAVSSGLPFLGRFKVQRGGVLFVGSDSSEYDYAQQWTRLTKERENLFEPVRFLIQSSFMFEDADEVRRLIRTHQTFEWGDTHFEPGTNLPAREQGFHVIIFDTLSKLTRANQNDNTEMEEVFRNIRLIAEATNAAVVLLHHNSKKSEFNDGADWRGAMSQIGALDSWVQLAPARKDKYLIGVSYKKFRGITPKDFSYRMYVDDKTTASLAASDEPVTLAQRMQFDVLAEAIFEHIQQHPHEGAAAIRDALWPRFEEGVAGLGTDTVRFEAKGKMLSAMHNRLAAMVNSGRVVKTKSTEGRAVYHVKEEPNNT